MLNTLEAGTLSKHCENQSKISLTPDNDDDDDDVTGDAEGAEEAGGQDADRGADLRGGQAQAPHPGDREDHRPHRLPHLQTRPRRHQPRQHGMERGGGEVG